MPASIDPVVNRIAAHLPVSERVVLEAVAALVAHSGSTEINAEALRDEVGRRQGRAISAAAFRQRLKRLNDSLKKAAAPFLLSSSGGRMGVQQTAQWDDEQRTDAVEKELRKHSDEGTQSALGASISPRARPDKPELSAMFSYAWLNEGTVGAQQHRIQDQFYQQLAWQLAHPPAAYADRFSVRLWRDEQRLTKSDQGDPQLDAACKQAFLGVLMLSDKYPHSKACLREAAFFLTEDGKNRPNKHCIIVPVNIGRREAPERFGAGTRIWIFNEPLIDAWARASAPTRRRLAKQVADEIYQVAEIVVSQPPPTAAPDHEVEQFARRWHLDHRPEEMVAALARRARLGADIGVEATASPEAEQSGIEIVDRLVEWACSGTGPRLTALLGEFGSGKTVTCQLLTQELLKRQRNGDAASLPLPLYFDLRNIDSPAEGGAAKLEKLIDDMLRRAGANPPPAGVVIEYVREKRALVIFDGLDEVTTKLTNEQAIRLYRDILSIVPASAWTEDAGRQRAARSGSAVPTEHRLRGPRLLVSCRSHYFRDVAAQRGFFTDMDRAAISADDDVQTFVLLPFSSEQIADYLKLHLVPDDAARALELIDETYNLRQLAERPILLRFIGETIGRLEAEKLAGRTINISRLYDILVDQTFQRDDPKHVIPVREKKILLRRLAHTLHSSGFSELSHTALDEWFVQAAADLPRLAPVLRSLDVLRLSEIFLQDLRNASLLVRPGEASFAFAHTSIREYFLADALHRAVCDGTAKPAFDVPVPSRETLDFLLARLDIADEPDRRLFRERFPALMTAGHSAAARRLAFAIWLRSGAVLPRPPRLDLSGLDFFESTFAGSNHRRLPLHASTWHGARLDQAEFANADLSGADFSQVQARMSRWIDCRLPEARFPAADLQGSTWRNIELPSGSLVDADLRDAESVGCRLAGVAWRAAPTPEARTLRPMAFRHGGWVGAVALGRAGERDAVVSGSVDGTVRISDAVSGVEIAVLRGHGGWVRAVALGRAGERDVVVSGGLDGTVRISDAVSGAEIAALRGHGSSVNAVALGRTGERDVVVSGGDDGTVRIADAVSGAEIAVLRGHDGRVGAVALGRAGERDVVVSGRSDGTMRISDAVSGAEIAVLRGHAGGVRAVALGRAGERDAVVSGGDDGTVRISDAASGAEIAVLRGHAGGVAAVALGRAGEPDAVVSGGDDGTVRTSDAVSGAEIAVLRRHAGWVHAVALGRVGERDVVVSGGEDGTVRISDAVSGAEIAVLRGHAGGVAAVALGRAGERDAVVSGGLDGTVRISDAVSGAEIAVLREHGGGVRAVALGRAGERDVVVSGAYDGTVRISDAVSGVEIAVLRGQGGWVAAVALGRAGERDVILSLDGRGIIEVADTNRGTFTPGRSLILGPGPETLLDLAPDRDGGCRLARLSGDAWRYWRAQGTADGRLVTMPIDDMPRVV